MPREKEVASFAVVTIGFCLALAAGYGYIANIVKLFYADPSMSIGEIVIRVVGIFMPLIGVIAGWF